MSPYPNPSPSKISFRPCRRKVPDRRQLYPPPSSIFQHVQHDMAGPDLKQLSSNWKILQERLKAGKRQEEKKDVLRRKKDLEDGKKKTKVTKVEKPTRRKMGGYLSKAAETTSNGNGSGNTRAKEAKLMQVHDIPAADISAAYGTSSTMADQSHKDVPNGGLHPTHKLGKYLAIDCEMVGTGPPPHSDNLLARASVVNFHGEQVYDSYVQAPPKARVEDYRTHVSGIKPHHMRAPYARSFAQVQADIAELLQGRILVGHALRNDLNALLLTHPKSAQRDTSRFAKFRIESRGKPPALRKLAKSELGMEIQTGEHSSIEDARATMGLFRKEKVGFEKDARKRFGQQRSQKGRAVPEMSPSVEDSEDDVVEEDDGDLDLIEGEEDDEYADELPVPERVAGGGMGGTKKKKKKKRTKRK